MASLQLQHQNWFGYLEPSEGCTIGALYEALETLSINCSMAGLAAGVCSTSSSTFATESPVDLISGQYETETVTKHSPKDDKNNLSARTLCQLRRANPRQSLDILLAEKFVCGKMKISECEYENEDSIDNTRADQNELRHSRSITSSDNINPGLPQYGHGIMVMNDNQPQSSLGIGVGFTTCTSASQTSSTSAEVRPLSGKQKRRNFLSLEKRFEIVQLRKDNPKMTLKELADRFGCGKTQISNTLQSQDDIEKRYNSCSEKAAQDIKIVKSYRTRFEEIHSLTYEWYQLIRAHDIPVDGPLLRAQAKRIATTLAEKNGDPKLLEFQATSGWLDRFKRRYNITTNRRAMMAGKEDSITAITTG